MQDVHRINHARAGSIRPRSCHCLDPNILVPAFARNEGFGNPSQRDMSPRRRTPTLSLSDSPTLDYAACGKLSKTGE